MLDKIAKLGKEITEIEKQFGGKDNIPMNYPYWKLVREKNDLIHDKTIVGYVSLEKK